MARNITLHDGQSYPCTLDCFHRAFNFFRWHRSASNTTSVKAALCHPLLGQSSHQQTNKSAAGLQQTLVYTTKSFCGSGPSDVHCQCGRAPQTRQRKWKGLLRAGCSDGLGTTARPTDAADDTGRRDPVQESTRQHLDEMRGSKGTGPGPSVVAGG